MHSSNDDEPAVLIVGCVRNVMRTLLEDLDALRSAFVGVSVCVFLVESDSKDDTVLLLSELAEKDENLRFVSLGNLADSVPSRTDRLAKCRNRYLQELDDYSGYDHVKHLCVADFDGVVQHLDSGDMRRLLSGVGWDALFANHHEYYYDIFALRHKEWCPNDYRVDVARLESQGFSHLSALDRALHRRMKSIPADSEWISVDSAFGGLALYRREAIRNSRYAGSYAGVDICEHVPFNESIKSTGGKLFICPSLIIGGNTEHTRYLGFVGRVRFFVVRALEVLFYALRPSLAERRRVRRTQDLVGSPSNRAD